MKGVLYMVVKKKEFYCNLGVQTGYAEIKPVLKAVRMPDGTVSSFCQFTTGYSWRKDILYYFLC